MPLHHGQPSHTQPLRPVSIDTLREPRRNFTVDETDLLERFGSVVEIQHSINTNNDAVSAYARFRRALTDADVQVLVHLAATYQEKLKNRGPLRPPLKKT